MEELKGKVYSKTHIDNVNMLKENMEIYHISIRQVAKTAGLSYTIGHRVFNFKSKNAKIINVAIDMITEAITAEKNIMQQCNNTFQTQILTEANASQTVSQ